MGLDITAYEKLTYVRPYTDGEDVSYPDEVGLYYACRVDCEHCAAAAGRTQPGVYTIDGERQDFRAGSYSGYNFWRRKLAELVGVTDKGVWDGTETAPAFGELINFSDCEGYIGPDVSSKLAQDFADWQGRAEEFSQGLGSFDGQYWIERYNEWRKAFELASTDGAVKLH